jgi:hypothetical protein
MAILSLSAVLIATMTLSVSGARRRNPALQVRASETPTPTKWASSERGKATKLDIEDQANVRFNQDYTDVESVSPTGYFDLCEHSNGTVREVRITSVDGGLQHAFLVGNSPHLWDAEAKEWLAKALRIAIRDGYIARERAAQIVKLHGTSGVVDEVPNLATDTPKRIYLEEAIKSGNPDPKELRQLIRLAARQISSDYERATFLIDTAGEHRNNSDVLATFFAAVESIKSDYERSRVLYALFRQDSLSNAGFLLTLASAGKVAGDGERADLLIEAARMRGRDERIRAALLNITKTIHSDYQRGRVISAVNTGARN